MKGGTLLFPSYMSCLLKDMLLFAQLRNGLAGAQTLGVYAPNQCLAQAPP